MPMCIAHASSFQANVVNQLLREKEDLEVYIEKLERQQNEAQSKPAKVVHLFVTCRELHSQVTISYCCTLLILRRVRYITLRKKTLHLKRL